MEMLEPCIMVLGTANYVSQSHSIIEWFGLEGTVKTGVFPPVQPGHEHFQMWAIHSFSGQPVPVPHHHHSKEFLPYI